MLNDGSAVSVERKRIADQRVADWLRKSYPDHRAKRIATDFNVDVRTATTWLRDGNVSIAHWHRMVAKWGRRFLGFVYADFDWGKQIALEAEIQAMQRRLSALQQMVTGSNASSEETHAQETVRAVCPASGAAVVDARRVVVGAGAADRGSAACAARDRG